jgi:hypothetical protein
VSLSVEHQISGPLRDIFFKNLVFLSPKDAIKINSNYKLPDTQSDVYKIFMRIPPAMYKKKASKSRAKAQFER